MLAVSSTLNGALVLVVPGAKDVDEKISFVDIMTLDHRGPRVGFLGKNATLYAVGPQFYLKPSLLKACTKEMWTPRFLWIPAQLVQMRSYVEL